MNGHILTGVVVVIYSEAALDERRLSAGTFNVVQAFQFRPRAIGIANIQSIPKSMSKYVR